MKRLTFLGAAGTVTGSKYLLETNHAQVMIDCGLFQGRKRLRERNWSAPSYHPHQIDSVVLTHAHLDHTGYLPRLVKQGFKGKVLCTSATRELTELILLDSAKNQKRDADYANRKGYSRHRPALPLYDTRDARAAIRRMRTVELNEWFSPGKHVHMRMTDAGHLLGSSSIEVRLDGEGSGGPTTLLFSGDIGRYHAPLYFDPSEPPTCDYLICESTYGDRDHGDYDLLAELEQAVLASVRRGGVILVAAFSIGRSQQLIYLLRVLMHQGKIPHLPIYLDSPMAVRATEVYGHHAAAHDLEEGRPDVAEHLLDRGDVRLVQTVAESKKLNQLAGPAVIISSSGMMTGGRILFHLKRRLPDPRNTLLMTGHVVDGTRGQRIRDGAERIRIHGQDVPVRAAVERLRGMSGHADRGELLRWLEHLPKPKTAFITHGEQHTAEAFGALLETKRGWNCHVPTLGESVELA